NALKSAIRSSTWFFNESLVKTPMALVSRSRFSSPARSSGGGAGDAGRVSCFGTAPVFGGAGAGGVDRDGAGAGVPGTSPVFGTGAGVGGASAVLGAAGGVGAGLSTGGTGVAMGGVGVVGGPEATSGDGAGAVPVIAGPDSEDGGGAGTSVPAR